MLQYYIDCISCNKHDYKIIVFQSKGKDSRLFDEPESVLVSGEYDDKYSIIKQLGKGAYGFVKLCYRKSDGLIVCNLF